MSIYNFTIVYSLSCAEHRLKFPLQLSPMLMCSYCFRLYTLFLHNKCVKVLSLAFSPGQHTHTNKIGLNVCEFESGWKRYIFQMLRKFFFIFLAEISTLAQRHNLNIIRNYMFLSLYFISILFFHRNCILTARDAISCNICVSQLNTYFYLYTHIFV
jgi:hypothetical protein